MISVLSYNVNGIRAAVKKGLYDWIALEKPDLLWLQETKAQPEQVDKEGIKKLGYQIYMHSAEKKGYSGVALLAKKEPDSVIAGIELSKYDSEGRILRADYGDITFLGCYFPSGTTGDIRQTFKMEFLEDFKQYILKLKETRKKLVISGDFNIAHTEIDINHPKRHHKTSGFLPEERKWLTEFLDLGFQDSLRMFDTRAEQYSWWTYRANARAKNLGWRIDYHLVSDELKNQLKDASILSEVVHSDHCPVKIELVNGSGNE